MRVHICTSSLDGNRNQWRSPMQLAEFITENSLTQRHLALTLGVTEAAISLWARGLRTPNYRNLRKIRALTEGQVSADDFLRAKELAE
jgi:transcriptional regulator with XRE-family HTH domain